MLLLWAAIVAGIVLLASRAGDGPAAALDAFLAGTDRIVRPLSQYASALAQLIARDVGGGWVAARVRSDLRWQRLAVQASGVEVWQASSDGAALPLGPTVASPSAVSERAEGPAIALVGPGVPTLWPKLALTDRWVRLDVARAPGGINPVREEPRPYPGTPVSLPNPNASSVIDQAAKEALNSTIIATHATPSPPIIVTPIKATGTGLDAAIDAAKKAAEAAIKKAGGKPGSLTAQDLAVAQKAAEKALKEQAGAMSYAGKEQQIVADAQAAVDKLTAAMKAMGGG
jgi:hypothetical protein